MDIVQAGKMGNIERIKTLLSEGVDINFKNSNGLSALYSAALDSNNTSSLETVKFLIDNNANVNIKTNRLGHTPLMAAAPHSNTTSSLDTVKLLIDSGADINSKSINGLTALYMAAKSNNGKSNAKSTLETVKLLLDNGADVFIKTNKGYDIVKTCKTDECKKLVSSYIWKKLYQRDIDTALIYSRQNKYSNIDSKELIFPKDVWEIILLNRRQQLLCSKLSSDKNREILRLFAMELNVPITNEMTKGQLCGLISKQIVYGRLYHKTEDEMNTIKKQMISIAKKFGIDTNRSIQEIIKDISEVVI